MSRHFYLVPFFFTWCLVSGETIQYGLLGETVTFNPGIKKHITEILWKHNGNKAVEFNGREEKTYGSFEGRVTLDWMSAELMISDLRYEDSGTYTLEAFSGNELQQPSYTLKVIDKVPKPTISCEMNNDTDNNKSEHQAKLTCSTEPTQSSSPVEFEWTSHGQHGPHLTVVLEKDEEVYKCTVKNHLTQDSATFTAKDCYGKDSHGKTIGIIVGVSLFIVIVIVGLFIMVLFLRNRKSNSKEKNSDEENEPLKSLKANGDSGSALHRSSTRPSGQKLFDLNRHGEGSKSSKGNRNEDEMNEEDKQPQKDVKNHEEFKKTSQPSQEFSHEQEDTENESAGSVEATADVSADVQTEDTRHQMEDDPKSSTEQPENHDNEVKKIPPPVPKKRLPKVFHHKNGETENETTGPVKVTGLSADEPKDNTQHQRESDPPSSTASEQPEEENHECVVKKTPPHVPKKPKVVRMRATADLSDKQTEDTQRQMEDDSQPSTASEQPEEENHECVVKKTPPHVPKKPKVVRMRATDLSDKQTEDTQRQMEDDPPPSTASEQPDVESPEGNDEKTRPPLPPKPIFQKGDTQNQMSDGPKSTASAQPENHEDMIKKISPPVPTRRRSRVNCHKNEDLGNESVQAIDMLPDKQTKDTQHQIADDPQPSTASELPGKENHEDNINTVSSSGPKKPKRSFYGNNETADPVGASDVLPSVKLEDPQPQTEDGSTSSEQPEKQGDVEKEEGDANTDQDAGKSTEANVGESDSMGLKEGNKVAGDRQNEKEEETNLTVGSQLPQSCITSVAENMTTSNQQPPTIDSEDAHVEQADKETTEKNKVEGSEETKTDTESSGGDKDLHTN